MDYEPQKRGNPGCLRGTDLNDPIFDDLFSDNLFCFMYPPDCFIRTKTFQERLSSCFGNI
jgi:hypothetical protein